MSDKAIIKFIILDSRYLNFLEDQINKKWAEGYRLSGPIIIRSQGSLGTQYIQLMIYGRREDE